MDIEQMKKDLGGGNVFPIGEENVAFAKYFTGECYLNILTTERVPDPSGYWWKRMVPGRRKTSS